MFLHRRQLQATTRTETASPTLNYARYCMPIFLMQTPTLQNSVRTVRIYSSTSVACYKITHSRLAITNSFPSLRRLLHLDQFLRSKQHDIDRIRYRVGTSSPDSRFGSIAVSRRENSDGPAFSTSDAYTLELECNYTMEYTGLDGRIENLPQCTKFVVVGVPSQLACKHPLPALFQSGAW
jgi:hypothetical protein